LNARPGPDPTKNYQRNLRYANILKIFKLAVPGHVTSVIGWNQHSVVTLRWKSFIGSGPGQTYAPVLSS